MVLLVSDSSKIYHSIQLVMLDGKIYNSQKGLRALIMIVTDIFIREKTYKPEKRLNHIGTRRFCMDHSECSVLLKNSGNLQTSRAAMTI